MRRSELLQLTQWQDPYADFVPFSNAEQLSWHFDADFLKQVVYRRCPQPELVLEVGSWLGQSAINAVRHYVEQQWTDFTLICVDTWLGSVDHWLRPAEHPIRQALHMQQGYPQLYPHFLSNVVNTGADPFIQPLPQTSTNASRIVYNYGLSFDWVYLDASHETLDVFMDINLYWPLVKKGGVLCGDDWNWPSVRKAVEDFTGERNLRVYSSVNSWAVFKI